MHFVVRLGVRMCKAFRITTVPFERQLTKGPFSSLLLRQYSPAPAVPAAQAQAMLGAGPPAAAAQAEVEATLGAGQCAAFWPGPAAVPRSSGSR